MRRIIEQLAVGVQSGGTLNEGMAQFPRAFPPHIVGTVAAGEVAGLLPLMLGDIALDYELAIRASNRVMKFISWMLWTTTYGLFLVTPAIPLMMRGGFAAMEAGATGGLPFFLKMMQPFFSVTMHITLPLLVIPTVLYHGIAWYLKQPHMRNTYYSLVLKMPGYGKASRERSMASFSRILWRLQNAGVMPIKAWEVASRVPENSVLAANVQAQTNSIAAGGRYSDALVRAGFFSQDDIRMIQTGESTGQLPDSLQRIAAYYEDAALVSANSAKWIGLRISILFVIIASGAATIGATSYMGEMINSVDKYMGTGQ